MARSRYISWLLPGLAAVLVFMFIVETDAAPPRKPLASQYSSLVTRSPFTIRSSISGQVSISPLERDWMLGSIRPDTNTDGWRVTLINKKDRKERVRLMPGFHAGGFQLLEVEQDPGASEKSRVRVRKGTQTAWIGYDSQLVKVRSSSTKGNVSHQNPAAKNNAAVAGPPIPGQPAVTKPRTRYVPKIKR